MNAKEQRCFDVLTRQGYKVLRRGWPDFLVITPSGDRAFALEFKADGDRLSDDQRHMHAVLSQLGLIVRVWKEPDVAEFRKHHNHGRLFLFPENLRDAQKRVEALFLDNEQLREQIERMRRTLDESCHAIETAYEWKSRHEIEIEKALASLPNLDIPGSP